MKIKYFLPLVFGYIVPTLVISYFFVIPGTCVETTPALNMGFVSSWVSAALIYIIGIVIVYKDMKDRQSKQ